MLQQPSPVSETRSKEDPDQEKNLSKMRKFLALMVLFCAAASADAAEPMKWCSVDGAVIAQTETGSYLLDGKPVSVSVEHGNWEEEGFVFIVYDDMIFAPCDAATSDTAECDEFFPCP